MNNDQWGEIINNATEAILANAREELGEEVNNNEIIEWLQTQQRAIENAQGDLAHIKESLLQYMLLRQANR